jgi:hypothetical protein
MAQNDMARAGSINFRKCPQKVGLYFSGHGENPNCGAPPQSRTFPIKDFKVRFEKTPPFGT